MHERAPVSLGFEESGEMIRQDFVTTRISDGLQFGHGSISGLAEAAEVLHSVDNTIHGSQDILVSVDRLDSGHFVEDDGCGDGREVAEIFAGQKIYKRSLNRSKVFGGAAAMTAASLIGTGQASGESVKEVFGAAISTLQSREIDFGAHTDEHASGDNCGCGAIDRAPEAILAALKYEQPIRDVISALGAGTKELDAVYDNYRQYVRQMPAEAPYSGREVMDKIVGAGKVVKKLGGEHRERRIILNTIREHTVNQALIRAKTDHQAQAFAVDIWRLGDIADRLFPGDARQRDQAYLSELIYTLAIAAVLTKGDLPVDMIERAPSAAAV